MDYPIIIISYNNYKYVENIIKQLLMINKELENNIQILDNNSTCEKTINYLKNLKIKVIFNTTNEGPFITSNRNVSLYNSLPDKFIITDPDLELNPNLPDNFIEIMNNLLNKYNCHKIGFALDISSPDELFTSNYFNNKNIFNWESQFWLNKIPETEYDLYYADIDTTFCLVNKLGITNPKMIRIAGNFTAKHLPWYKENPLLNIYENYLLNSQQTRVSTTSRVILEYINTNFIKVSKNDIFFFIRNDENDPNLSFWKNVYKNWEKETFEVFDKYLDTSKVFIDIGAWVGATSIYGARKSKHIYAIEADIESFKWLETNCKNNCENYTLINKAIFNKDDSYVKFGKNKHLNESKLDDSTSQISTENDIDNNSCMIKTITVDKIIKEHNISYDNISLIKVDIEGCEEFILNDLYKIYLEYKIPIYISFHYSCWEDSNLDRFLILSEEQKLSIKKNPFISLLFC